MADDDDVPQVVAETPQDLIDHTWKWIHDNEAELERLAAETGQRQERTIGIALEPKDRMLLQVHITCEPREFATITIEGEWAPLFKESAQTVDPKLAPMT